MVSSHFVCQELYECRQVYRVISKTAVLLSWTTTARTTHTVCSNVPEPPPLYLHPHTQHEPPKKDVYRMCSCFQHHGSFQPALQNKLSNERQRNCSPFLLHSLMIRIFSISTQRRGRCISYAPPNILRTSSLVLVKHHWSSAASAPFLLSQQLHWSSNWFSWPTKKKKTEEKQTERGRKGSERGGSPYFTVHCCFLRPVLHTNTLTHRNTTHTSHLSSVGGRRRRRKMGGGGDDDSPTALFYVIGADRLKPPGGSRSCRSHLQQAKNSNNQRRRCLVL